MSGTLSLGEALVWIGVMLAAFAVLALVSDLCEKSADRRRRWQARAEARATRQKETDRSDSSEFSWESPSS